MGSLQRVVDSFTTVVTVMITREIIKGYTYSKVCVSDYTDLVDALKVAHEEAVTIEGKGLVFLYISSWVDMDRLPSWVQNHYSPSGQLITEQEYYELTLSGIFGYIAPEGFWEYKDEDLKDYIGGCGTQNMSYIFTEGICSVNLDFVQRVTQLEDNLNSNSILKVLYGV